MLFVEINGFYYYLIHITYKNMRKSKTNKGTLISLLDHCAILNPHKSEHIYIAKASRYPSRPTHLHDMPCAIPTHSPYCACYPHPPTNGAFQYQISRHPPETAPAAVLLIAFLPSRLMRPGNLEATSTQHEL